MEWEKSVVAAVAILCLSGFSVTDAEAAGFGFYFGAGGGYAGEKQMFESGGESSRYGTSDHAGIGMIYDTNVLKKRGVFNYRLNVGYERMKTHVDVGDTNPPDFHDVDWDGVVVEQDFGFGGRFGERVRLWWGPSVRLSYHAGSDRFDNDFNVAGIGFGPVMGANFGLTDSVALSLRLGYLFNSYRGEWKRPSGANNDFRMTESRLVLNLGMLFGGLK